MKSKLFKFALFGILLCSFSLQGFTPPLPPGTTVCVDGLPSCYAAKVVCEGSEVIQTTPRTREWFLMSTQCSYDNGNHHVLIDVYTKATSTSSWIYRGYIYSDDPTVDINYVDDYLYFIDTDYDQLTIPPPVPE
jgi:hypothetical protein